ncbi:hypothetical protein DYB28_013253, partial [Aphanomyces astaci]
EIGLKDVDLDIWYANAWISFYQVGWGLLTVWTIRLMMFVFKEGSSVLFVISSAVCLPLTDILYMVPALAGPLAAQKFTIFDGFALFIIILGMVVYHSEKEEQGVGKDRVLKSPLYASPSVRRLKANIQTRRKKATSTRVVSCGYGAVATEDAV